MKERKVIRIIYSFLIHSNGGPPCLVAFFLSDNKEIVSLDTIYNQVT